MSSLLLSLKFSKMMSQLMQNIFDVTVTLQVGTPKFAKLLKTQCSTPVPCNFQLFCRKKNVIHKLSVSTFGFLEYRKLCNGSSVTLPCPFARSLPRLVITLAFCLELRILSSYFSMTGYREWFQSHDPSMKVCLVKTTLLSSLNSLANKSPQLSPRLRRKFMINP